MIVKRTKIALAFLLGVLVLQNTSAQDAPGPTDSVRIEAYLPIRRADPAQWVTRYQKSIDKYIDENRTMEDRSCDALFFGSSSINRWNTIYDDMAPMKVLRRSYGGATIRDMIYNYDVIARGYDPKVFVLYVGNDITTSATGISVGDTYDLFRVFINMVRRDYPDTPFVVLSLIPSFRRAPVLEQQKKLNYLLEEYAGNTPGVYYMDITAPLYDGDGNLRPELYDADNLHVNAMGYAEWTKILRPALLEMTGY